MKNSKADEIVLIIKDIKNLKLTIARGQCCDGAASMSGKLSGVAIQLKSLNGKCLYTHCYGHALNLDVGDIIKSIHSLLETFDTNHEICKLVKISPQRDKKLDEIRSLTKTNQMEYTRFVLPDPDGKFEVMLWHLLLKTIMKLWSYGNGPCQL